MKISARRYPNVLVTGTPGVGKSTLCEWMESGFKFMRHVDVGQAIKEHHLYSEWDDENDVSIFDEDQVVAHVETLLEERDPESGQIRGGFIVDFHSGHIFAPELFDLVIVLRCTSDLLFRRLEARGYAEKKIRENVECEIFRVVLDEVKEAFEEAEENGKLEIWEKQSDSTDDQMALNETLEAWMRKRVNAD